MKFDPVDEGVLVDRSRVRGAVAQRLAVGLAGSLDVRLRDRREGDKRDGVDFDHAEADPIAAALLDLRPLPQPDRQRDIAGQDVVAQLTAELHTTTLPATEAASPRQPLEGGYGSGGRFAACWRSHAASAGALLRSAASGAVSL